MAKVEYLKEEVELSRKYPFGETKKVIDPLTKEEIEVTVLTVNEINGKDEEVITKAVANTDKLDGYVAISVSAGLTYDESLMLASKDSKKISAVLQNL